MKKDYSKLKKAFSDDPEMLRKLAHEEMMQGVKEKTAVEIAMLIKKGEKGDTPIKGKDYFTEDEVTEIAEYVKETVKEEVRPRKGKDYFDGAPGRPGKDADENKIYKSILEKVPTPDEIAKKVKIPEVKEIDQEALIERILKSVPEPKILTLDEIVKELKSKRLLELRDIRGARLDGGMNMNDQRWHGGGLTNITGYITAGTDISITGSGTSSDPYVINATGGGGGTPGGSDTQLQYNNAGAFGGITGATTDGTVVTLTSPIMATSMTASYATASTIAIFDGSKNLISATTATYPDLTELSYVKGVTSAIQTQLNAKLSGSGTATYVPFYSSANVLTSDAHFTYDAVNDVLHVHKIAGDGTDGLLIESENGTDIGILGAANTANVTWYGAHNFSGATQDTIAAFTGAGKTLSSLATATYPNLTELSYLKGTTSSLQTQLDSKENKTKLSPIPVSITTAAGTVAKVGTTSGGSYTPAVGDILLLNFTQSNTAYNPTLNIDGSGAIPIRVGGQQPTFIAIMGTSFIVYYDGTYYEALGSQRVSDYNPVTVNTEGSFVVSSTSPVSANSNYFYIANSSSRITYNLAASTVAYASLAIIGKGSGGFRVAPASGDSMYIDDQVITYPGYIDFPQGGYIKLMSTTQNDVWTVETYIGEAVTDAGYNFSIATLGKGGTGAALSDPGYDAAWVWDDTMNQTRLAQLASLSYDSATNTLSATGSGTPTDITVANEATDTSCFVAFFTAATGDLGPKTNANLAFNSNTGLLSATLMSATTSVTSASILASSNDSGAIGASGTAFSDLFLASGAVINFNAGNATLTHSASLLTSNVDIAVPDEAYGAGWNGSLEVPTKNAVYDKIETLSTFTAKTIILQPVNPVDPAASAPFATASWTDNTTMRVYQVIVPFAITANKLSVRTVAVATPEALDITMYAEDGQSQIFSITTATLSSANSIVTYSFGAPQSIPAGIYYIGVNGNGTINVQLWTWDTDTGFNGANSITAGVTGEPVMEGTLTITAGTPPATIDPTAITGARLNSTIIRLDN